jgi:hypothetical protein
MPSATDVAVTERLAVPPRGTAPIFDVETECEYEGAAMILKPFEHRAEQRIHLSSCNG